MRNIGIFKDGLYFEVLLDMKYNFKWFLSIVFKCCFIENVYFML